MEGISRRICEAAARGISALGVDARFRPRNDIEVNGKKISGTGGAFDGDALMYQGTLLIEFDVEKMLRVLRIPAEKLSDKAIASARERVTNLRDLLGYTPVLEVVQSCLMQAFADEFGVSFEQDSLSEPEQERYRAALAEIDHPDWVNMLSQPQSDAPLLTATRKFSGGLLQATLAFDALTRRIKQVWFTGDFFISPRRAIADLEAALKDSPVNMADKRIADFFAGCDADMLLLTPDDFALVLRDALAQAAVVV
jgi:lipoate-protein ligase A